MSLVERTQKMPARMSLRVTSEEDTIQQAIRSPVRVGIVAAIVFFGTLALWSVLAPLVGAVIATGRIEPEGATRTVQHLEGGIVSRILVKEGQLVAKGDPLLELQDVQARSRHDELEAQDLALQIRQSRLLAEQSDQTHYDPYAFIEADENGVFEHQLMNVRHRELIDVEKRLFEIRRKNQEEERGIYESRIVQLRLSINGREDQIHELESQKRLLDEEIANVQFLIDKGLESLPRFLALKRMLHQLLEREAQNRGEIAETGEQIGDFTLRRLHSESQRKEEIDNELSGVHEKRAVLAEQLVASRDVMTRTVIAAPTAGVVANIRIHTTGGVLSPGAAILDLVPNTEPMIVEAKVRPTDIDHVRAGQAAMVHLSAYSQRYTKPLAATVETVSADLIEDPARNDAYYSARLRIEEAELAQLPDGVVMTAGMPVEVYITTEARSVVSYLLEPMAEGLRRAFREP
jgi:membrane fusion protein, type I secretion system